MPGRNCALNAGPDANASATGNTAAGPSAAILAKTSHEDQVNTDQVRNKKLKPESGRSEQRKQEAPMLRHAVLVRLGARTTDHVRDVHGLGDVLSPKKAEPLQPHASTGDRQSGQRSDSRH